ncbi:hypothetical protein MUB24_20370 [Lederbergia sp. NSJ-179]|uniref:hypothetical protein n=1 Tax=Lederbergia sp. NSJ-179 TaxID=2931402 RepID=UPI001FD1C3E9|nr:hypothetical protein [Lederbergia sp. NSJ-179]MCJ7843185.1 hypothetical protein [Lederbergia sp. NSJ-179]
MFLKKIQYAEAEKPIIIIKSLLPIVIKMANQSIVIQNLGALSEEDADRMPYTRKNGSELRKEVGLNYHVQKASVNKHEK